MNYKQIDTEKIKAYIAARPEEVLVDDIMVHSREGRLVEQIIISGGM